jgi:hypothetical protein
MSYAHHPPGSLLSPLDYLFPMGRSFANDCTLHEFNQAQTEGVVGGAQFSPFSNVGAENPS